MALMMLDFLANTLIVVIDKVFQLKLTAKVLLRRIKIKISRRFKRTLKKNKVLPYPRFTQ